MTHYNKLPVEEKEKRNRDKMREPAVTCPLCETQTPVDDLLEHIRKRCPGKRELHPRSRWVTWREALAMGVNGRTLKRWVRRGHVRRRAPHKQSSGPGRPSGEYLARDIVKLLAARWIWDTSGTDRGR